MAEVARTGAAPPVDGDGETVQAEAMTLVLLLTAMIALAVLAPRYGADSRERHLRTTAAPHPRSSGRGWVLQEPGSGQLAGSATAAVLASRPLRWVGDHLVGDVFGGPRQR
jgi:hypothetical protein